MCGYQPESQMLELWSSHRRRMVYSVQPARRPGEGENGHGAKRYLIAIPVVIGLIVLLSGCVVDPYRHGYYGHGHGHGHGGGYRRDYDSNGYNGYGGGGWRGHRHRRDYD